MAQRRLLCLYQLGVLTRALDSSPADAVRLTEGSHLRRALIQLRTPVAAGPRQADSQRHGAVWGRRVVSNGQMRQRV